MSFINESFNIGKKNMVVGNGKEDFNISSINGHEVRINGIVPGAGGGGGVPPIGDIDFIGNLNCNDVAGGGTKGIITAEKKVVSGSDGIFSTGLIKTGPANDIHSGKDLVFDGDDIYKEYPNIVPPEPRKTYKEYKGLVATGDDNIFTGSNQFNDNTTEFSFPVSVGIRDPVTKLFTQNLALNTSGNIESKTINNTTEIQCGNINCGNSALNEVRARVFNTRTNENNLPDGWILEQQVPSVPAQPLDKILQIKAQEVNASVNILSSDFSGSNGANIILNPGTDLNGGFIQAQTYYTGTGSNAFYLKQDRLAGGASGDELQIKAPSATATVNFKDNSNADVLIIKNASVDLKNDIPLNFGTYTFRPQQYTLNFTGAVIDDNPAVIFNSGSALWTDVNNGGTQTLHNIGNNFFKMTIIGVPTNSAGVYGNFRWSGDFPFLIPNFSPAVIPQMYNGNFCIIKSPGGFQKPTLCGYSSTSTDYKLCFPSVPAGTETFSGTIRITIMNT